MSLSFESAIPKATLVISDDCGFFGTFEFGHSFFGYRVVTFGEETIDSPISSSLSITSEIVELN